MKEIKVKVDDKEFSVSIPLYKLPYVTMFRTKLAEEPKTVDEAKKIGEMLKECYEQLKPHIAPEPSEDEFLAIIINVDVALGKKIMDVINKANFPQRTTPTAIS